MKSNQKKAIIVGILYILGIVSGILSIDPVIEASDYLFKVSANSTQITFRALFQFDIDYRSMKTELILKRKVFRSDIACRIESVGK